MPNTLGDMLATMPSAISSTDVVDAVPQPVLDGLYAEFSSALPSVWTSSASQINAVDAAFTADSVLENGSELQGNIALVSRGADDATFVNKVKQLSEAGAIGVIVVNTEDTLLAMPVQDDGAGCKSTIPVLMIKHSDVARLREPGGALIRDKGTT